MTARFSLRWVGRPPGPAVRARLAAAGIALARAARPDQLAAVVAGDSPARGPLTSLPWIWMPGRAPRAGEVARATAAGAYDVVCGRPDEASRRLLARLGELEVAP